MLKTHNIWTYDACRITFGTRSEQIFTKLIKIHKEAIKKQLGFYSWCSKQTDKQLERGTAVDKWKTIVREEEGLQLVLALTGWSDLKTWLKLSDYPQPHLSLFLNLSEYLFSRNKTPSLARYLRFLCLAPACLSILFSPVWLIS